MVSPALSAHLNLLRWLAAFLVVISHIRPLLFVDYGEVHDQSSIAIKIFYFLTGFGHEAVVIFFVISGLLVGGVTAEKYRNGFFDSRDYLIHRFTRIYIVLIPALLAGFLLDQLGTMYLDASGLYSNTRTYRFSGNAADQLGMEVLLGNALMLQEILVTPLGSNNPLWSLSYEWWYYIVFFFVIQAAAARRVRPWAAAAYILAALLLLALLPLGILMWFSIWLAGMAIILLPLRAWRIHPVFGYAALLAALAWSRLDSINTDAHTMITTFRRDWIVAAGCLVLLTALKQRQSTSLPGARLHRLLAEFSYTTYLVHVPFLLITIASLHVFFGIPFAQQPTPAGFAYFLFLLWLTYMYCYGFSRLTENHTARLRRYLSRRFNAGMPLAAAK